MFLVHGSMQIVFSFLLPLSSVSSMQVYVVIDMETTDIPSMRLQEPLFCYVNAPMVNVISVWGCLVSAYSATVLDLLYCLLCFAIQSLFGDALAVIFSSSGFCEWRCHSSSFLRQGHSF